MALALETRRNLDERDRRWLVEFCLRAFTAGLSFLGILLLAVTVEMTKDNYGGNDWVDGFPIAPVSLYTHLLHATKLCTCALP